MRPGSLVNLEWVEEKSYRMKDLLNDEQFDEDYKDDLAEVEEDMECMDLEDLFDKYYNKH